MGDTYGSFTLLVARSPRQLMLALFCRIWSTTKAAFGLLLGGAASVDTICYTMFRQLLHSLFIMIAILPAVVAILDSSHVASCCHCSMMSVRSMPRAPTSRTRLRRPGASFAARYLEMPLNCLHLYIIMYVS